MPHGDEVLTPPVGWDDLSPVLLEETVQTSETVTREFSPKATRLDPPNGSSSPPEEAFPDGESTQDPQPRKPGVLSLGIAGRGIQ